jgi:predicted amidohydrolase
VTRVSKREIFRAACLQFDVRRGDVAGNVGEAERLLRLARADGVRLAVLPELWSTSFCPDYPPDLVAGAAAADARLAALSAELAMTIAASGLAAADGRLFNRASVFERGSLRGDYHKLHLFSLNAEDRQFTAGDRPVVVDSELGRIALAICYDLRFPELIRWFFYQRAEILVVPAQWPEARANHWRSLLDARAVENQLFVLGCNRTGGESSLKTEETLSFPGNSRIVDPMGEVIAAGSGEPGAVVAEIETRKARTMRRMMPIERDRRPALYREIWDVAWPTRRVSPRRP